MMKGEEGGNGVVGGVWEGGKVGKWVDQKVNSQE